MRTAVSIPDALAESIDRLAKRLGVSRSEIYARALEEFTHRHDQPQQAWWLSAADSEITRRMNEVLTEAGPQSTTFRRS